MDSPTELLDDIYKRYVTLPCSQNLVAALAYHTLECVHTALTSALQTAVPTGLFWLKTLDASVAAVNQGGKRKGACCVYLETWHADIMDFLELRDNTGDEARRTYNLNLSNWVSDLFMKRVEADAMWSLFDPKEVPQFHDLYGEEFETAFVKAEEEERYVSQIKARDLYARMMRTLAQTGNGWMTFKDRSNITSNQTGAPDNVIHLSNLCQILEVTPRRCCATSVHSIWDAAWSTVN